MPTTGSVDVASHWSVVTVPKVDVASILDVSPLPTDTDASLNAGWHPYPHKAHFYAWSCWWRVCLCGGGRCQPCCDNNTSQ